jgi:hypothetical protein
MNREEHLQRIVAKCRELLAIAEKPLLARVQKCGCIVCKCDSEISCYGCGAKDCGNHALGQIPEPVYKPHCAGPAEAGWGATIAAIEGLNEMRCHYGPINIMLTALLDEQESNIIAAWPEELL